MKLWQATGRISYYLLWPLISVYLFRSERTRIVVHSENKILVVRGWLSDGRWSLPGGGIQKDESIISCALRELREETGLSLKDSDINILKSEDFHRNGVKLHLHYCSATIPLASQTKSQRGEIVEVKWLSLSEINPKNTSKDTLRAIAIWKAR